MTLLPAVYHPESGYFFLFFNIILKYFLNLLDLFESYWLTKNIYLIHSVETKFLTNLDKNMYVCISKILEKHIGTLYIVFVTVLFQ